MRAIASLLGFASLAIALPALAAAPPPHPISPYYVTDGRTAMAGPFHSFEACRSALDARPRLERGALFCASEWIRHDRGARGPEAPSAPFVSTAEPKT